MSDQNLTDWRKLGLKLEAEINKVILGQEAPIRLITNAIFARGHVLLEGDVGVGKTTLLKAFARSIGGGYERIEGTIDSKQKRWKSRRKLKSRNLLRLRPL